MQLITLFTKTHVIVPFLLKVLCFDIWLEKLLIIKPITDVSSAIVTSNLDLCENMNTGRIGGRSGHSHRGNPHHFVLLESKFTILLQRLSPRPLSVDSLGNYGNACCSQIYDLLAHH